MRFHRYILFLSALIFSHCGVDVEDAEPPSPPRWVPKSTPEEWPERGIDAHESGGVMLEWYSNPEPDIASYELWRARHFDVNDSLGEFERLDIIDEDLQQSTITSLDQSVQINESYFYTIHAVDDANNKSACMDTITYKKIARVGFQSMAPNGLTDTLQQSRSLTWKYSYGLNMEDYVLTVVGEQNVLLYRCQVMPTNYTGDQESHSIPDTVVMQDSSIYRWRVDVHADYEGDVETSGGESRWATFFYFRY